MIIELKKIITNRFVLVLIALLLTIQVLLTCSFQKVGIFENEEDRIIYETLLKQYQGKLTLKNYTDFQELSSRIREAEKERMSIYAQLRSDSTEQDSTKTKERLRECKKILEQENAVAHLTSQVNYAYEDLGNRSVLNPFGFRYLLQDSAVSIPLMLTIILINTVLFTQEYDSDMQLLAITTKNGKRRQFLQKCQAGLLFSTVLTFIFMLLLDIPYFLSYDMSGYSASMQSIQEFSQAPFALSLLQAYLCTRAIRLLGYLLLAALTWVASVYVKKFFPVFFTMSALSLLLLAIPLDYIFYLPFPMGAIRASGFLRGPENIILNRGKPNENLLPGFFGGNKTLQYTMLAVGIFLMLILVRIAYQRYGNFAGKNLSRPKSFAKYTGILLIVAISLTGCGISSKTSYPNEMSASFTGRFSDYADGILFYQNKEFRLFNGAETKLFPLPSKIGEQLGEFSPPYKIIDEKLYLMIPNADSATDGFRLYCYDLKTKNSTILYETEPLLREEQLFGFIKEDYLSLDSAITSFLPKDFFFYQGEFYYLGSGDGTLWKQDASGNTMAILQADAPGNIFPDGEYVYYVTIDLSLARYHLDTGRTELLSEELVHEMQGNTKNIFFTIYHTDGLFSYENGSVTKVADGSWKLLASTDGYCYLSAENQNLYIYEENTGQLTKSSLSGNIYLYPTSTQLIVVEVDSSGKETYYVTDPLISTITDDDKNLILED